MSEHARTLHRLIGLFRAGQMKTVEFCDQFEKIYNLEIDKTTLSAVEAAAFEELFNRVVWYSPFPEEVAEIPHYLGDEQIREAVERAAAQLGAA